MRRGEARCVSEGNRLRSLAYASGFLAHALRHALARRRCRPAKIRWSLRAELGDEIFVGIAAATIKKR